MKNLPTFDSFLNESMKKSDFLRLDYESMADEIISDQSVLSYISGDKLAYIMGNLKRSNDLEKLRTLINSLDLKTLKLYPLTTIAQYMPEFADRVVDALANSNQKEKISGPELIFLYTGLDSPKDLKPILNQISKFQYLSTVISCPSFIELIDAKMCAIGAATVKDIRYVLEFFTLPDEFITIEDKQIFLDNLPRDLKQKVKSYSNGDLSLTTNITYGQSFPYATMVGPKEMKYVGQYKTAFKQNTEQGRQHFNRWFSQLNA